eukprot:c27600_g1_i1 orf=232-2142(+)
MLGCGIRALWVLNQSNHVLFSRRFPTVDRQWRVACRRQRIQDNSGTSNSLLVLLPSDNQLVQALVDKKARDGSIQGTGIHDTDSVEGSDSWVDDPITRHIISLQVLSMEEGASSALLWPLILLLKGQFQILVLPLVQPRHMVAYNDLCWRAGCGSPMELKEDNQQFQGLSSMLLGLPCITGAFVVAKTIGDIVMGDAAEAEVLFNAGACTGGSLDSLTVGIGITNTASRGKAAAPPISGAATAVATVAASATSTLVGSSKGNLRPADKDVLRNFISSSMPFGTPLDLSVLNLSSLRINGFSALDIPPTDQKQPAWKPYLYKGKQKILLTIAETVTAALYDRDDVLDMLSLSGQINCRADLEGIPDVSLSIACPSSTKYESFTFHPCAQASEHFLDKQTLNFSPPMGSFVLARYLASSSNSRPPVQGFYQLSMVSEDEGAFLFKLRLMEGYKAPFTMEYCFLSIPFPRQRILALDGNPSMGTISVSDHLVEWKIVVSGRGLSKNTEATFPGTIKFGQMLDLKMPNKHRKAIHYYHGEEFNPEIEADSETAKGQDLFQEKMSKGDANLAAVDLDEPFCWEAYSYAKVSFKVNGGTMTGISLDSKSLSIYPAVKVPCECSSQVLSGEYIFWNENGSAAP